MSITERFRNKLFKMKKFNQEFISIDSGTTNNSSEENIKKKKIKIKKRMVSFNSVEIIDVESYKEYNKLDCSIELESLEPNRYWKECDNCRCILL